MNILLISYLFPPTLSSESIVIGKLFGALEGDRLANIDVLTGQNIHLNTKDDMGLMDFFPKKMRIFKLPSFESYIFYKIYSYYFPWWLKKPDNLFLWRLLAKHKAVKLRRECRYDFIIASVNPLSNAWVALQMKKIFPEMKLVFLINDPVATNPFLSVSLSRFEYLKRFEHQLVITGDLFVFPCPELRDFFLNPYASEYSQKTAVIPHSYQPLAFAASADIIIKRHKQRNNSRKNKVVLSHVGAITGLRKLTVLSEAIPLLPEVFREQIIINFVGHVDKDLQNIFRDCEFIVFKGPVSYKESLRQMQLADVLLLVDADIDRSFFFPGKLPDYLASDRPIIAITTPDSCVSRILSGHQAMIVAPNDARGLAQAIIDLVEDRWPSGKSVRDDVAKYSSANVAKLFYKAIKCLS